MGLIQYFLALHRQAVVLATVRRDHKIGIPIGHRHPPPVEQTEAAVVVAGVEVPPVQGRLVKAILALAGPPQAAVAVAVRELPAKNRVRVELASAIQLVVHQQHMLEAAVVTVGQDSLVARLCQEEAVQVRAMVIPVPTKMDLPAPTVEAAEVGAGGPTAVVGHWAAQAVVELL
jgi:hypothetical protein